MEAFHGDRDFLHIRRDFFFQVIEGLVDAGGEERAPSFTSFSVPVDADIFCYGVINVQDF